MAALIHTSTPAIRMTRGRINKWSDRRGAKIRHQGNVAREERGSEKYHLEWVNAFVSSIRRVLLNILTWLSRVSICGKEFYDSNGRSHYGSPDSCRNTEPNVIQCKARTKTTNASKIKNIRVCSIPTIGDNCVRVIQLFIQLCSDKFALHVIVIS